MTTRIGIDFGTANTVVAGWDEEHGRGVPIPLPGVDVLREAGPGPTQRVVPSLIAYTGDGGTRRLGSQVTPEMFETPGVTVFASTKTNVSGHAYDAPRKVGDRKITGREAATRFLSDIMALALLTVEDDDLEIVATAPVESFDRYRDWLVREVRDGLPTARLRVVDEATAAAVGYHARLNPGDAFAVVDFGAGTLDVSVVRVQEPDAAGAGAGVRTIAKKGLDLGGNTIDALLAEHAVARLSLPAGDQIGRNQVFRRLLASAERAKRDLATAERADIEARDARTDATHRVTVTRAEFDALLRDKGVLRRINQALRACLESASSRGYGVDDIRQVFLVGGSCLIPAVQDVVALHFDPDVVRLESPLEAVATGAAGIAGEVSCTTTSSTTTRSGTSTARRARTSSRRWSRRAPRTRHRSPSGRSPSRRCTTGSGGLASPSTSSRTPPTATREPSWRSPSTPAAAPAPWPSPRSSARSARCCG